jgi:hypothetical protein
MESKGTQYNISSAHSPDIKTEVTKVMDFINWTKVEEISEGLFVDVGYNFSIERSNSKPGISFGPYEKQNGSFYPDKFPKMMLFCPSDSLFAEYKKENFVGLTDGRRIALGCTDLGEQSAYAKADSTIKCVHRRTYYPFLVTLFKKCSNEESIYKYKRLDVMNESEDFKKVKKRLRDGFKVEYPGRLNCRSYQRY